MNKAVISGSAIVVILIAAVILTSLSSGDSEEPKAFTDAATATAGTLTAVATPTPIPTPLATNAPLPVPPLPDYFPATLVSLNIGEGGRFLLSDGSPRTVKLLDTNLVFSDSGLVVWATATVEVTAPGRDPVARELPVSYFRRPWMIEDLKVWVSMTNHFEERNLRNGGVSRTDARLVLADARLPMTDLSEFAWPFGDLIWQEGSENVFYQGIEGRLGDNAFHHGAIDFGMPRGTPLYAWRDGVVNFEDRGFDFTAVITDTKSPMFGRMQLLHLESVIAELDGKPVTKGTLIGYSGQANWYHTHLSYDFTLGPALAEWYQHGASPEVLSYAKDWLVAGPFFNPDDVLRLGADYLNGEMLATPELGREAANGREWMYWDNVVPGVVMVGEAISPFPYSNYAAVTDNYPTGAAYLGTYVYAPEPTEAVMRFGSSDSVTVWIGQTQVLTEDGCISGDRYGEAPTIYVDQYQKPVSLEAGWNRVLVKTAQRDGCPESWQISLRFSDENGMVLDGLIIDPLKGAEPPEIQAKPTFAQMQMSGIGVDETGAVVPGATPEPPDPVPTATPTQPPPTAVPVPTVDIDELIRQGIEVKPIVKSIPGGLSREKTPVFLSIGSDDNFNSKGVNWFVNDLLAGKTNPAGTGNPATFDGLPARMSFYIMGELETYGPQVASAIRNAYDQGHELGNHAYGGFDGGLQGEQAWYDSISRTNTFLTRPVGGDGTMVTSPGGQLVPATGIGMPPSEIYGYRTPLDEYNVDIFPVLAQLGFLYHSSTAQAHSSQSVDASTDLYWPGTLENGIPFARAQAGVEQVPSTPGLWELPQSYLRLPEGYDGVNLNYCDKEWFWVYRNDDPEVMADKLIEILKYNLDLRIAGNRAPMSVCVHSQEWTLADWDNGPVDPETTAKQRILTEFLDYALSKPDVRVVRQIDVINWIRNPQPLQ